MIDFSNFHYLDNETDEVKKAINDRWGSVENFYFDLFLVHSRVIVKYYNPSCDISKIKELYEATGAVYNFDDISHSISDRVLMDVFSKNKNQLFKNKDNLGYVTTSN